MKSFIARVVLVVLIAFFPRISQAQTWMDGHWIFLGGDIGGAFLDSDLIDESNKQGFHAEAKGLYSFYSPSWVVDAGAGYFYNWLGGTVDVSGIIVDDTTRTRAALLELSPRYRLTRSFEIGIQTQGYMGTDTRFATTGDQVNTVTVFSGPQLVFNLSQSQIPLRFSLAGLTDWNAPNRQVYLILAGVQFGFRLSKHEEPAPVVVATPMPTPSPSPSPTPEPTPTPTPEPTPEPIVVEKIVEVVRKPVPDLVITFDTDTIHFKFDRADLSERSRLILREIAEFITLHNETWNLLIIEGHTDSRGTNDYNQKLSEKRASRVMNTLILYGVSKQKIQASGQGESVPLIAEENEIAWAKNRRVEMIFDTVKDVKLFKTEIEKIRAKYGKPEIFPYSKTPESKAIKPKSKAQKAKK